ncbi:hypothetical protein F7725_009627 [Dissostichus mawsoni]|uniref:Uncharacterized protein n=1 Tax=Dissostichus mawsoni TaxID=36200 RepID=A0A7J5XMR9_DISMA|nr:hypothetical protein F7725_009627 [Dissostichus mawsoni]
MSVAQTIMAALKRTEHCVLTKIDSTVTAAVGELHTKIDNLSRDLISEILNVRTEFTKFLKMLGRRTQLFYSRIDYFIVDDQLLPLIPSSQYHSIVLVQMDMMFPGNIAPQRTWRLDPHLLSYEHFKTYLSDQIDFFLEMNDTKEISRSVLWESLKAYIRGQAISYTAHKNKERSKRLKELTHSIADVDRRYALLPMADLFKEKVPLQFEFNTLSTWRAEKNIKKLNRFTMNMGTEQGDSLHFSSSSRRLDRRSQGSIQVLIRLCIIPK